MRKKRTRQLEVPTSELRESEGRFGLGVNLSIQGWSATHSVGLRNGLKGRDWLAVAVREGALTVSSQIRVSPSIESVAYLGELLLSVV
ncbi:hypothetical protein OAL35_01270 [bacterium]|nr:hypothetical protein [bacterium]